MKNEFLDYLDGIIKKINNEKIIFIRDVEKFKLNNNKFSHIFLNINNRHTSKPIPGYYLCEDTEFSNIKLLTILYSVELIKSHIEYKIPKAETDKYIIGYILDAYETLTVYYADIIDG